MSARRSGCVAVAVVVAAGAMAPPAAAQAPRIDTLDNGLKVVAVARPQIPLTTFALYIDSGRTADGDRPGLTALALETLWKGHGELDEDAVEVAIERVGGEAGATSDAEWSRMSLSCPSARAGAALQLLRAAWTAPRVSNELFARERDRQLALLERYRRHPGYLAERAFRAAVLGEHRYVQAYGYGTELSLRGMDTRHVEQRLAELRDPARTTLFVVGPPAPALHAPIAATFGRMPARESSAARPIEPPQPSRPKVVAVHHPEMTQVYLSIGTLGIDARDPRRPAVMLLQQVLTGGFTSVLVDELRVDRGLVYGITASQSFYGQPSPFAIRTSTRADKVVDLLEACYAELRELASGALDADVLTAARNTLLADLAAATQTHLGIAAALYDGLRYHGDAGRYAERIRAVRELSADDVIAAAKMFDPAAFTVVQVGDRHKLEELDLARHAMFADSHDSVAPERVR